MDKLEICNMALAHIGATPIMSLTEESEEARRVVQFYEHDRRVVLRRYPWPWAMRRAELTRLETTPEDFAYAYRYPANCVCLRKLYSVDENDHYLPFPDFVTYQMTSDATGKILNTNEPRVAAEYTLDLEDNSIMDEMFADALTWKLAASVAFKLTGNAQIVQMSISEYERIFSEALSDAENEQNLKVPELNTFIRARF